MIETGISADVETPGRESTPDAALLLALTRSPRQKDGKTQVEGARIRLALESNLQQVDALRNQRIEGRLAILLDAWNAMMWSLKPVKELRECVAIHKAYYKVRNKKEVEYFHLVHNLPARSFNLMESLAFQSETKRGFNLTERRCSGPKVTQALTLCIKAGLAEWGPIQFPVGKKSSTLGS